MHNRTLELLKRLTKKDAGRQIRLRELLKQPDVKYPKEWSFCVPPCFNEALDIQQTERVIDGKKTLCWTQGTFFSFKQGDTLYDTPKAYEVWSDALKHINTGLSVKAATNAGASEDGKSRFTGSVTFTILKPDKQRTKLVKQKERTISQDDFVEFLIIGDE